MMSLCALLSVPFVLAVIGSVLLSLAMRLHDFVRTQPLLPSLHFRHSPLTKHLLTKCRLRERSFSPSFWLRNAHVQTIVAALLPTPEVAFEREYLQMRDRGVVALDWALTAGPRKRRSASMLLLLVPAITGDALGLGAICLQAAQRGFTPVVFNRRGHGGSLLTTAKLQSAGDPSDLRQVIKYLHLRYPKAKLAAVAYGTGCGLLMSYLGEFGSSALLSAGVCISPCYDVPERFSNGARSLYDHVFLLRQKAILARHAKAVSGVADLKRALLARSHADFDQSVYCPMYGIESMEEFWDRNNPVRDVDDISVPVLCINSLDDPFYAGTSIPYDLFRYYPNLLLVATERGGHCGFLEGIPPRSWAEILTLDYLEAVIEFTTKGYKPATKCSSRSTI